MNVNDMRQNDKHCSYCGGHGMTTVYHRFYEGSPDVMVEDLDRNTVEVVTRKMTGTMGAYCLCRLGAWMYAQIPDEDRSRLCQIVETAPRVVDVFVGGRRTEEYGIDDPHLPEIDRESLDAFWDHFRKLWQRDAILPKATDVVPAREAS